MTTPTTQPHQKRPRPSWDRLQLVRWSATEIAILSALLAAVLTAALAAHHDVTFQAPGVTSTPTGTGS